MADAWSQKRIAELLFGPSPPEELTALYNELGVSAEEAPRLLVYRRLVRGNLREVSVQMMPRTRELLGDRWDEMFAAFLGEVGPRTHYLRDVPHELLAFAAPRWKADPSVPRWAADLAAFELAFYAVSAAAARDDDRPPVGDLALDRAVLMDDAVRQLDLDWSVHEEAVEARPTHLLVYRDAEHTIRTLTLSPLAAALVRRLLSNEPLGNATRRACADVSLEPTGDVLGSIAQLLADFGERGVLLGSANVDRA